MSEPRMESLFQCAHCGDGGALRDMEACAYCGNFSDDWIEADMMDVRWPDEGEA